MGIEESLEKILKKLDNLSDKIDSLAVQIKSNAQSSPVAQAVNMPEPTKSPSLVAMEQKEEIKPVSSSGRLACPKCNATNVQALDNKDKVISASGGIMIYAKKYYCKKCGHEWE